MAKAGKLLRTRTAVREHFGVSWPTVHEWVSRGAPIPPKGPYDAKVIQQWIDDNLKRSPARSQELKEAEGKPLTTQLLEEQVLKLRAQRKREEIGLDRDRGDLVPKEELEEQRNRLGEAVRTRFLGLPNSLAPELNPQAPGHAREVLMRGIREVLEELSIYGDGA